jgi:hypothetical protein
MMVLLRRIAVEKRLIVVLLAVGLAANLLAYTFVVRPRGIRAAGAADRAAAAATALRTAERDRATAGELVAGKARADEALATFYGKVLPADQEAAVRMTYARLPALARKSGVKWERRTSEMATDEERAKKDEKLGHLVMTMVLQGRYGDFRNFIFALESAPEFWIVDNVVLSEGSNDAAPTFTVTLSTYFRLKNHGA